MNGELGVPLDNAHQFANFLPYVLSLPVPERPRRVARSFPHLEVVNSWFCIETDLPVIREGSPILSRRQEAREHEKKILILRATLIDVGLQYQVVSGDASIFRKT
jgi:hypothetical protein